MLLEEGGMLLRNGFLQSIVLLSTQQGRVSICLVRSAATENNWSCLSFQMHAIIVLCKVHQY